MNPPRTEQRVFDRRAFLQQTVLATSTLGVGLPPLKLFSAALPQSTLRVRVWSEGTESATIYPDGIDGALADAITEQTNADVTRARLEQVDAGLSDAELDATDVLVWWGRFRHLDLPDDRAEAVAHRVETGRLGFVALHDSCLSKPFQLLMGRTCAPGGWREDGRPERVEVLDPTHPLAYGVTNFTIPRTASYHEPFEVPEPEGVVFRSTWDSGDSFRSGLTWTRGQGRVVYFRPGNDGFPVLFHPMVRKVIANAVLWTAPTVTPDSESELTGG